jgi:hypothetical protein
MKAPEKSTTIFVNGKEVDSFQLTGDEEKDMAAAKKLLAEQHAAESRTAAREQTPEPSVPECANS